VIRGFGATIAVVVSGLAGLSVLLDGLLDSRTGCGENLGIHGRGDGEPCIEGEKHGSAMEGICEVSFMSKMTKPQRSPNSLAVK
jgi:hypothetical protein